MKPATKTGTVNPEPDKQTLADAIVRIGDGVQALQRQGLNKKALLVLLSHQTGLGQKTCETVIDGLADLKRSYCR